MLRKHFGSPLLLSSLALSWVAVAATPLAAEDFRVETRIYVADGEEPSSTNITRFKGAIVWDFAGDGSEIVMFDKTRGRFALLDLKRKIRTEVTTEEVLKFTQQLRDWAAGQEDPLLKFCAAPRLERATGTTPGSLKFSGSVLSYEIETERPSSAAVVTQYREFSDWYARVNTLFRPGSLPPFPRLMVNEHLAQAEVVPQRVRLTLAAQPRHGSQEVIVRSEQDFTYGLLKSDLGQIDRAAGYLVTLKPVSLGAYRQEETASAGRAATK